MKKENEFGNYRFEMLKYFDDSVDTKELKALAAIKCEPTWYSGGKQYLLFESAPDYIKIIEDSLIKQKEMKEKIKRYFELKENIMNIDLFNEQNVERYNLMNEIKEWVGYDDPIYW